MTDLELFDDRTARDRNAGRVEVLEKVKALRLLPGDTYATTELVAAYYEVDVENVKKATQRNLDELKADGFRVLDGESLRYFKSLSGIDPRARSLAVFPRRAILRVGMLLRDSAVARQVRTYLLDAEAPAPLGDPLSELEAANDRLGRAIEIAKAERAAKEAAQAKVAELEVPANAWNRLGSAEGDYSVADAAKILSRDPAITTGRNRLFGILHELDWAYVQRSDHRYRAKQYAIERRWLSELPSSHYHPRTGELMLDAPQVRVTHKGLTELHKRLGGIEPLHLNDADQLSLS